MEASEAWQNGVASDDLIAAAGEDTSSLNGFGGVSPDDPLADSPELVLAAGLLGGLLLAGVVSRIGR
jgi:hypothetical protein